MKKALMIIAIVVLVIVVAFFAQGCVRMNAQDVISQSEWWNVATNLTEKCADVLINSFI